MINREEAQVLISQYLKNDRSHVISYSVELIMKKIAKILGENEELWGLTGLLFNIDYEYTADDIENRGNISSSILDGLLPEEAINAIKANNYVYTDYIPSTSLDKAVIATSSAVEFIIKVVKTTHSKKINDVDLDMLVEKFKDDSFVTEYDSSRIKLCKDVEFKINDFLNLVLQTLKENFE